MASCGIFKLELEFLLPEIISRLNASVDVSYVPPALHVDYDKLAGEISGALGQLRGRDAVLLFGSMCHPKLPELTADSGAPYLKMGNCVDAMLSPERKSEIENKYGKVFYMTSGWLRQWRGIMQEGMGWDTYDARVNMGFYDYIIVLDSGVCEISEEELFEFYEYVQVPVEVEPITLDYFKSAVIELCCGFLAGGK